MRRPSYWDDIEALITGLPPDSATKRAIGEFTETEMILDELLQHSSAHRIEFLAANSKDGSAARRMKPASRIARLNEARTKKPKSILDVYRELAPIAEDLSEGGE